MRFCLLLISCLTLPGAALAELEPKVLDLDSREK